jgi:UDP-N-acetylmuramoyl-tripeptide--D-alanyl-D-alanine ligase
MKNFIIRLLERRAKQLLVKFNPMVVVITGSVGKTSTKIAIAAVLSEKYRVLAQYGSYNTPIALPLAMFNMNLPRRLWCPLSWFGVYRKMGRQLRKPSKYDVLVLELGADRPGDIEYFKKYLHPDIAVVTAVSYEHMQYFGSIDAVAKEELSVANFSNLTLINRDDIHPGFSRYVADGINIDTYGNKGSAEYYFEIDNSEPAEGFKGKFMCPEYKELAMQLKLVGEHNIHSAVAAGTVGIKLGLSPQQLVAGMQKIRPMPGRMNLLKGVNDSTIIDDSYNSNPTSAIAALKTLYAMPAKQKIAILGSMNELGNFSAQAHKEVGEACDLMQLDWVVTVGDEAAKYIVPAAAGKGCQVRSFNSPYEAGAFVNGVLRRGAAVLVKGSQNGVFTEEAIKEILHSTEDEQKLVRQTPEWLRIKQRQFEKSKTEPDDKV